MTSPAPDIVENTIPVLAVANVEASIEFYRNVLDFQLDWQGDSQPLYIASVSRDDHAIMLERRTPLTTGCVWIGVSDLSSLWAKIRSNGSVEIVQRPTNQRYALDMRIKDPDGNILWFGTEPLNDFPVGTEPTDGKLGL
jgi:predicted enzyme related to lactoylglutathione lyase